MIKYEYYDKVFLCASFMSKLSSYYNTCGKEPLVYHDIVKNILLLMKHKATILLLL